MASTNKTPNLNLNQWIGSDKPKRIDFNGDNSIIDNVCGSHINNNDIHITVEERDFWNTQIYVGFYFGTGHHENIIELGYKPKAVFIYSTDKPLGIIDGESYSGMATGLSANLGIKINENGFSVYNGSSHSQNGIIPSFNKPGIDYGYIVFKNEQTT